MSQSSTQVVQLGLEQPGGFGGEDVLVIEWGDRKADVTGIDAHKLVDLPIITCLGLIMTTRGPAIVVAPVCIP
jgi:hypothetical protein